MGLEDVLAFILGSDLLVCRPGKIADGIGKVVCQIKGFSGVTGRTVFNQEGMSIKHGNRAILQGGTWAPALKKN